MKAGKSGMSKATQKPPVSRGDGASSALPMRRQTMGVQVHALLRREIITGRLLPRTMLSEQELSQRFGTSRTPVREALIKLAEENLVTTYPQYASFVAPISLADVFDNQFVREAIECAAVERAVELIEPPQAKALTAILDRQRLMHRAGDDDGFFQADEGMHAQIMAVAGHPNAWRMVENLKAQLDRVRHLNLRQTRKRSAVLAEHGVIIERLIARDTAAAVGAMRVHLRGLFRSVEILRNENAAYFTEDSGGTAPPSRTAKGAAA
jgi:GntR family transcriptional regulator, rspAB operon transcriptional repressor